MSIRETFSKSIALAVVNKDDNGAVVQISDFNSVWAPLPYCFMKAPVKQDFLDIYLTTFSESVISVVPYLWGSTFFWKCSKFDLDLKNAEKNWGKGFCVWDNCIYICFLMFSLLGTGYLSWEANVLTSSRKIWHVNKTGFP